MKKRNRLLLAVCFFVFCIIVAAVVTSTLKTNNTDDFFFCSDSFFAVPQNTNTQLSLTFYFDNENNQMSQLSGLSFVERELADNTIVTLLSVTSIEKFEGYNRAAVRFEVNFKKPGIYTESFIETCFSDGSKVVYPIGFWTFDVGVENNSILYNTIISTVNRDIFRYSLDVGEVGTIDKITKIIYGVDMEVYDDDGLPLEGNFSINTETELPLRIIQPKFIYESAGEEKEAYGTPIYLGAMNAGMEDIECVREYCEKMLSQR